MGLINDFADFLDVELRGCHEGMSNTPPPSALDVLQQRFFDALDCQAYEVAPEKCSLRCTELFPIRLGEEPVQYKHEVCFEEYASIALRKFGQDFAVPLDVVMLGLVTAALFR